MIAVFAFPYVLIGVLTLAAWGRLYPLPKSETDPLVPLSIVAFWPFVVAWAVFWIVGSFVGRLLYRDVTR